jgi:hypothetical protein
MLRRQWAFARSKATNRDLKEEVMCSETEPKHGTIPEDGYLQAFVLIVKR